MYQLFWGLMQKLHLRLEMIEIRDYGTFHVDIYTYIDICKQEFAHHRVETKNLSATKY